MLETSQMLKAIKADIADEHWTMIFKFRQGITSIWKILLKSFFIQDKGDDTKQIDKY